MLPDVCFLFSVWRGVKLGRGGGVGVLCWL